MTLFSKNCWLKTDQFVFNKKKHIQLLTTDIFKCKTGVSPELMNDICHFVERPYNLRNNYTLERKRDYTFYKGSGSHSSFAPKLLDLLPNSNKKFCFSQVIQNKN